MRVLDELWPCGSWMILCQVTHPAPAPSPSLMLLLIVMPMAEKMQTTQNSGDRQRVVPRLEGRGDAGFLETEEIGIRRGLFFKSKLMDYNCSIEFFRLPVLASKLLLIFTIWLYQVSCRAYGTGEQ